MRRWCLFVERALPTRMRRQLWRWVPPGVWRRYYGWRGPRMIRSTAILRAEGTYAKIGDIGPYETIEWRVPTPSAVVSEN